jgi:phosphohistidine phosphatase SixA
MRILLVRHGEALGDPFPEVLRPLSPRGRKSVRLLAKGIEALSFPIDRIYSSPLTRAIQSAEILLSMLRKSHPARLVEAKIELASDFIPWAFDREAFLGFLAENYPQAVILVGHEPNLMTLASWIDGDLVKNESLTGIRKATGVLLEWDPEVGGHYQGRISHS